MTKTALITGITGQDGSYLADLLVAKEYNLIGMARRSTHYHHPNISHLIGKITLEHGDLMDSDTLNNLVAKYQPDEVYNLAAQSVPADSWHQPIVTAEITGVGTIRMLEAVRRHKPDARFYQATSREIYGGVDQEEVDESTPFLANNPYGIAKLYSHLITRNYRESYDMFACGGILFNHESPRRGLHFVTRKVTMAVACIYCDIKHPPVNENGQPLVQEGKVKLGNLDAVRDWGYAKEFVEAMWLMLQQDTPQDYVIGTNTAYTVRDLCQVAFDTVGLNWEDHVVSDAAFMRPTEIAASRGNYAKAKAELGWEPEISFQALIDLMVKADIERVKNNQ
ncbi:GDP-mannose 4,6-dehydratase [Phototrophicus methaneseepsis]|uniref:GDP-mannose 4,6-dehydratase n=1 Tax=Phototrophicus methaneseepsis TaxID=2710758 RepID=A0A7S8E5P8_9CHLR|nr:GDP-mannose 4,6-dehydratase [Phototrophicus methaneseepsis]QPC80868.1 GDP-mannose 4,6-dehydratase [Phototrophicus methaneseepsis]